MEEKTHQVSESKEQQEPKVRERRPNPHRQNLLKMDVITPTRNPNIEEAEDTTDKNYRKPNPNKSGAGVKDTSFFKKTNQAKKNIPKPTTKKAPKYKSKKRYPPIDKGVNDIMRRSIEENRYYQEERMESWRKIDSLNKTKIRFTPLGGLGEIGGNMAVLESETTAIIIDVGMSFPDETMHGVDILIPDFSYLHTIKHKIKAVVITHGHEDHIGAVPYLFKELKFPIYGTPLVLAMIENKFLEHGLKNDTKLFRFVTKRKPYTIGDLKVEWMHVTHSIIDSSSLAIETPAGTIIHTADFKIDHTPIDGYTTDLQRFAYYGEKGILCLFSDSTNSHNSGFTKSEVVVGDTFNTLFEMAKGRVIMSTFSSNVHRIYQAMKRAISFGRKICVIGRSMERNVETTRALGYIDIEQKHFIEVNEVPKYGENEILIVTTGSQGESMAALNRMATNEHRHIKLKSTDTVIISASAIPGNEASVSKLMNQLMKVGVTVRYKEFLDIHVSGHAAQEEQKLIIRLVQPKFFLPVHGEYNHISRHAKTAISCGIDERNILLMSDGDQVELTAKYLKKLKTIKSGKTYIDNQNNMRIEDDVVLHRQKLAEDGLINIAIQIAQSDQTIVGKPVVTTYGIIAEKESKKFIKEIEDVISKMIDHANKEVLKEHKSIENEVRTVVRKHIVRSKKKYPLIIPSVFIV